MPYFCTPIATHATPGCAWRHSAAPRRKALRQLPVSAASEAKPRTVGDAINSFTLQDDLFLPFRGPLGRAMHPNAVWLESEGFLFDKTKRNLSELVCRGFRPCNRFIRASPLYYPPRRAQRGALPPHAVWPANIYVPPRAGGPCASRAPRRSIRTGRARGRRQYRRDAPAPRRRGRAGS